jgi:hypothetical protein
VVGTGAAPVNWSISGSGIGRTMSANGVASPRNRAIARSPASISPTQHSNAITIGLPWARSVTGQPTALPRMRWSRW